ncbi:Re/Si-specific NAD(P)(+) transhydrogenase subunit alpha [Propionicicella superfundia]|uniref:Re/Si-specific NAD(P)(+) transhydrogenase subunit alpha n=1 Tax=Propionicicella superfundia TaxID=348582 RepID=UPI00048AC08A|nr:Re/Si-specific NAD(P)(+) transhydrogenase subunit alpha [Propionicicella superfundia]
MRIGIPIESAPGEQRVAATPATAKKLIALGYDVAIQSGAGAGANFSDADYAAAGVKIADAHDVWASDVILKVNIPTEAERAWLAPGTKLACLVSPASSPDLLTELAQRQVTTLAMDAVPRISRAQSMDVLSSMANLAGYRAVVEAAHEYSGLFSGQVTAAGKIPPAKVLVLGAGVAGLAAIGTAVSMGAIVRGVDVRPEVAEQVESMGATFLTIEAEMQGPSADGYAKETSSDFDAAAQRLYAQQATEVDIIITTAQIPGRPAPRLITADMVQTMRPGSIVVDLAASSGGNCELTRPGEKYVTPNGVIILGYADLAGRMPAQASQLYGTNLVNLFTLLTPEKDGQVHLDLDDQVIRGLTVTNAGDILWPPPRVQVSAAPVKAAAAPVPEKVEPKKGSGAVVKIAGAGVAALCIILLGAFAPAAFLGHLTVFALAVIVGFYVIGNVHHALHTPLMSVTNAISGIIIVGALLQLTTGNIAVTIMAFVAVLIASINIFGGFTVTHRMLQMFRREER